MKTRCFIFFMLSLLSQLSFSSSFSSSSPSCFALFQFSKSFSIQSINAISFASYICTEEIGITSYTKMASWKEGTECCAWDGVECDNVTGDVISIDLSCSGLFGTFHSNSTLFQLHHLKSLNLAGNDFNESQIPSEFGNFKNLKHLNLSFSGFSGRVPHEIFQLSSLLSLDLSKGISEPGGSISYSPDLKLEAPVWRGLIGNLTELRELSLNFVNMSSIRPSSLMNLSSSLASLSLSNCEMRGEVKENILRLPNMQTLDLRGNQNLKGYFPRSNWSSSLRFLDLSDMTFSGELPYSIGNLKSLESLHLSNCNLTGSIPAALGNLAQMTSLDLSNNNLTGLLPSSILNLTQLSFLDISIKLTLEYLLLSSCNLTGSIPAALGNLAQMTSLDLSNNNLTGSILVALGNLGQMTYLDLSYNNLTGSILAALGNLAHMTYLDLSYNNLIGSIQADLGNLTQMTWLDLSYNTLTGLLPSSAFNLTQLLYLDISNNQLIGSLPSHVNGFPNLTDLRLGNNLLNGTLPSWLFTLPSLLSLNLSGNELTGYMNEFQYYQQLESIDLSNNKLHGSIPRSISRLVKLGDMSLSSNNFSGVLKFDVFSKLTNLRQLNLHSNTLEGPLPALPPSIVSFLFSKNKITGEIPLLTCNTSYLQILDLSDNNLSGMIPQCLGNFSNSLSVLNLGMNRFHGSILTTFSEGQSLRNLNLNGNRLEGSLPRSLVNCMKLEILDIGNNKLNDTFPHWLGSLPQLRVLVIRSNLFHGSIENPKTKSSFPNLRILDLSHNDFSGILPINYFKNLKAMMDMDENQVGLKYMGDEYYQDSVKVTMKGLDIELEKIQTFYTTIDFSNNSFRGEMPQLIGKLKSLKGLNFSHNKLTGNIPPSLGNLSNLEWLDLSSNKFVGEIPRQLVDLPWLEVLNLSQNQLTGLIPAGKQFNTFDNDSYLGNLGLCGSPLSKMCSNHEAQPSPPSTLHEEDDSLNANGFGWKVVLLGYGCGVGFGMILGYLVFKTGKPKWLVSMVELEQHIMLTRLKKNACKRGGRRN